MEDDKIMSFLDFEFVPFRADYRGARKGVQGFSNSGGFVCSTAEHDLYLSLLPPPLCSSADPLYSTPWMVPQSLHKSRISPHRGIIFPLGQYILCSRCVLLFTAVFLRITPIRIPSTRMLCASGLNVRHEQAERERRRGTERNREYKRALICDAPIVHSSKFHGSDNQTYDFESLFATNLMINEKLRSCWDFKLPTWIWLAANHISYAILANA